MKKNILFAIISFILFLSILYYLSLPDYLVLTSISFSNASKRNTELQVVVYHYQNTNQIIKEIEEEHNQINGIPTTLTINLHHSKWSLHNGNKPFYTITINYGKKSRQLIKLSAKTNILYCIS